jgi:hypothetical protein
MNRLNPFRGTLQLAFMLAVLHTPAATGDPAAAGPAPDILGISLGMTPEEVRAAFKASGLPFQLTDVKTTIEDLPDEPFLGSIYGRRQGGDSRQDQVLVNFSAAPNPLRVVMVTRIIDYAADKGPLKLDVAAALEGKYGSARQRLDRPHGIDMAWILTPAGIPVLDKKSLCPRPKFSPDPQGHIFFAGLTIQDGCGVSVGAEVDAANFSHPTLASALWISLVDYDELWKQIEKTQGYIAGKVQDAAKARGTPQL